VRGDVHVRVALGMVIFDHHQQAHRFLQDLQDARSPKDKSSHSRREPVGGGSLTSVGRRRRTSLRRKASFFQKESASVGVNPLSGRRTCFRKDTLNHAPFFEGRITSMDAIPWNNGGNVASFRRKPPEVKLSEGSTSFGKRERSDHARR